MLAKILLVALAAGASAFTAPMLTRAAVPAARCSSLAMKDAIVRVEIEIEKGEP